MVVRSNERVDEWLKCVMAVYIGEGFDYFNFNLICLEKEKGEKKMMESWQKKYTSTKIILLQI